MGIQMLILPEQKQVFSGWFLLGNAQSYGIVLSGKFTSKKN